MSLARRTPLVAGIALVAVGVCLVVFMVGRADFGRDDPFDEHQVAGYLTAIHEHRTATRTAFGFGIVVDGVLVLVVGAAMYDLFSDRSQLLAALTFAGFVANGAVSGVADCVGLVLTFVAEDFVRAGPDGSAVLALGRALGIAQRLLTYAEVTSFAVAEIALGAIVLVAPSGAVDPPRLLGWLAFVAGAAGLSAWGALATDGLFVLFVLNSLATLVLLFSLGGWLICDRHPAGD